MIIVKGSIPVKTSHQEEALKLIQGLAAQSRGEQGCLAYEVYILADAPETIVIWQQWSGLSALETHFASEHVDAFLDAIPDLIEGEVTSARFDVVSHDEDLLIDESLDYPAVQLAENTILH
jgi:quinol monooxygenase YgiN